VHNNECERIRLHKEGLSLSSINFLINQYKHH
jgi:hypothetical protein